MEEEFGWFTLQMSPNEEINFSPLQKKLKAKNLTASFKVTQHWLIQFGSSLHFTWYVVNLSEIPQSYKVFCFPEVTCWDVTPDSYEWDQTQNTSQSNNTTNSKLTQRRSDEHSKPNILNITKVRVTADRLHDTV